MHIFKPCARPGARVGLSWRARPPHRLRRASPWLLALRSTGCPEVLTGVLGPQSSGTVVSRAAAMLPSLGNVHEAQVHSAVSPEAIVPKGRNKTYRGVRQRCAHRPRRCWQASMHWPGGKPGLTQAVGQVGC